MRPHSGKTSRLLYRVLHPFTWHMRWEPEEFLAHFGGRPGVRWQGRFFPAQRWQEAKDSWQGVDSIICATGPSLNLLAGFAEAQRNGTKLVGVNGAVRLRDREPVMFDLFVLTDSALVNRHWNFVTEAFEASRLLALSPRFASAICLRDPGVLQRKPFFLINQVHEMYGRPRPSSRELEQREQDGLVIPGKGKRHVAGFSLDPQWGVYAGGTVVIVAMQLLAFFGVRRIAIAGMDLASRRHFYAEHGETPSRLDTDYPTRIEPAMRAAARAATVRGFELVNLSAKSRLPESVMRKGGAADAGLRVREPAGAPPAAPPRRGPEREPPGRHDLHQGERGARH